MEIANSKRCDHRGDRVCIRIAGISMAVISRDSDLQLGIHRATEAFLIDEAKPDASVETAWGDLREESGGMKIFDADTLWQLYRKDGSYRFCFTSSVFGSLPYKVASFNLDFTSGEVLLHLPYFHPGVPVYPLEYPLDELWMVNLLARGRGVEIHACGVVDALGNGHLFLGQSGAGKSTMARLWEKEKGINILSDDRIVLRQMGQRLWMYGTPWHGDARLACPARAPLTRVYFLLHGGKNELVPQRAANALGRLFACSFPPFYSPRALDFTLGFLEDVVEAVPCYELRFLPDERVVKFIQQETEGNA